MKRFFFLLFCLIATPAWGAVAFDAASTASADGVTSLTFSHTTSGANRLITCGTYVNNDSSGSLTYAGQALALVNSTSPLSNVILFVHYKATPTSGANNVVVTSTGGAFAGVARIVSGCQSFTGVDPSTPLGTSAIQADTNPTQSVTITIPTNGLGVDFGWINDATACGGQVEGGSQTARLDFCDSTTSVDIFGSTKPTTGSTSMMWSLSGGGNYAGLIGVPINAAATATRKRTAPSVF